MKGIFIPEITEEMFRNGCLESIEQLMAEGEIYDIEYPLEQKTGHWIWCGGSHKCSNCEEYTCFSHKELLRYCPNCGLKMEREVEDGDRDRGAQ